MHEISSSTEVVVSPEEVVMTCSEVVVVGAGVVETLIVEVDDKDDDDLKILKEAFHLPIIVLTEQDALEWSLVNLIVIILELVVVGKGGMIPV